MNTDTPNWAFLAQMGSEELRQRMRLLDNEIRIMRSDTDRIRHESVTQVSQSAISQYTGGAPPSYRDDDLTISRLLGMSSLSR